PPADDSGSDEDQTNVEGAGDSTDSGDSVSTEPDSSTQSPSDPDADNSDNAASVQQSQNSTDTESDDNSNNPGDEDKSDEGKSDEEKSDEEKSDEEKSAEEKSDEEKSDEEKTDEEKTDEEETEPQPLAVELTAENTYAVVGLKPMVFKIKLTGGVAPCDIHYDLSANGASLLNQHVSPDENGEFKLEYMPVSGGDHSLALTVTDADGTQVNAWYERMPVSVNEGDPWTGSVSLSGDRASDLVAVAQSQLYAGEKTSNFIIDENGAYHYYTRFGDFAGDSYMDSWQAAFVAFCLEYAGISEEALARDYYDCGNWFNTLNSYGLILSPTDYAPQYGDIVFLSGDEYQAGVVSNAYEGGFVAVQGNVDSVVGEYAYSTADYRILGYVNHNGNVPNPPAEKEEPVEEEQTEEEIIEELPAEPQILEMEIASSSDTVELGESVTLSAVLPEGVDADSLIWQWQMYSATNGWMDIDEAWEPNYSFTVDTKHLLNPIRVLAQTMPVMAAFGIMSLDAESEPAEPAQELYLNSASFSLTARSSDTYIYWNPVKTPIYDVEGYVKVAGGDDTKDGLTVATPVQSFSVAVGKAEGKTIVCMNLYSSNGDDCLAGVEYDVTIIGYDGGTDNQDYAHHGQFISSDAGIFTAKNLKLNEDHSTIDLAGGELVLSTGNSIAGPIHLSNPVSNYLPITVQDDNGCNEGKYEIDFPTGVSSPVGIAKGNVVAKLCLTDDLLAAGWELRCESDGNTYAVTKVPYEGAVYVDGRNGRDSNDGNSEENPVQTLEKALDLAAANNLNTVYVMNGGVILNNSEYSSSIVLKRHPSCIVPMFRVLEGEKTVNLNIVGSISGPVDDQGNVTEAASSAAIFDVSGGKLIIGGGSNISGAASYAVTMSGGSLDVECSNIESNGIVKGSAESVDLGGSMLSSGSNPLVDVSVTTDFSADGATLTGPAVNTLIIKGPAVLDGGLSVNSGNGTVVSSGSLTVDGVDLAGISAAGTIDVKNCSVTNITNSGSSTTLETVSASTLSASGTVNVKNCSTGGVGAITVSGSASSLVMENSKASSVTAANSVELKSKSNVTGNVAAQGNVTVNDSQIGGNVSADVLRLTAATVGGTADAKGDATLLGSGVAGKITAGGHVELKKNDTTTSSAGSIEADSYVLLEEANVNGDIKAGSYVTVKASTVTGAVDAGGNVTLEKVGEKASSVKSVEAQGTVTVTNSTVTNSITAGSDVTVNASAVGGAVSSKANVEIKAVDDIKSSAGSVNGSGTVKISNSDVNGALTAGGDATLDTVTVAGDITARSGLNMTSCTAKGNITVSGNAVLNTVTANTNNKKITVRGTADVDASNIAALTVSGVTTTLDDSTVGTLDAAGTATINSTQITTAKTVNAVINNSTELDGTSIIKTINSLTATGNTTLNSGKVDSLVSNGNVSGNSGSIGKLELKGASSTITLGGDSYKTIVSDIILSGSGAHLELYGQPAAEKITLSITTAIPGRLVAEGMDGYNASQLLKTNDPKNAYLVWTESDTNFWLNKDSENTSNVVIEGATGIYVNTNVGTTGNGSFDNPFKTFKEAADELNKKPGLPRMIYVIGPASIESGDSLKIEGERVTVVSISDNVTDFITVNANFTPENVDFDAAGASTLFKVASGKTLDLTSNGNTVLSNAGCIINNSGTVKLGSSSLSASGTAINNSGTLQLSSSTITAGGTGIINSGTINNSYGTVSLSANAVGIENTGTVDISGKLEMSLAAASGTAIKNTGSLTLSSSNNSITMASGTAVDMSGAGSTAKSSVTAAITMGNGTGAKVPAGSLILNGSLSMGSGIGVDLDGGSATIGSDISMSGANLIGIDMEAESSLKLNSGSIAINGSGTGIDMAGGQILSDSTCDISVADANGICVNQDGGKILGLGGSMSVPANGVGLDMAAGTEATVKAKIDATKTGSYGIKVNGAKLTYQGGSYNKITGVNAIDVKNSTVYFKSGYTANANGSYYYKNQGIVTLDNSTLYVSGGTINHLKQTNNTANITNISSGSIYYMDMENGKLNSSGGNISNLTMQKGTTNVTAGSSTNISSMTMNDGTTNISGGYVSSMTMNKGQTSVKGGQISSNISVYGGLASSVL
ncbi:MAG: hypothetical protein IJ364_08965, partial [Oscillospiraceae bacterium]|nr:hypothetical protein [Oscillospiraceae bacterium]